MYLVAAQAVHTTGVNWSSVSIIVGLLTVILGAFAKYVANQITRAINQFQINVISLLDRRLTTVETKVDDVRSKQNQYPETGGTHGRR